jgi:tetratricopeptide (TPR) repeat protein
MGADLAAWSEGKPLPSEALRQESSPDARDAREDLSATRRTRMPLDDSGSFRSPETTRTVTPIGETSPLPSPLAFPAALAPVAALEVPSSEPPPAPPPSKLPRWPVQLTVILLAAVAGLASQMWVRGEASGIRHDLATEASPDLDGLWSRYHRIAPFGLPGSGLSDVRQDLKESLVKSADRILATYRGDTPSTTKPGWQKAHDRLKEAVDVDYSDKSTRAKMLYTQGHLDRIDSQGLRAQGKRKEAQEKLQDAVYELEEAAKLAPAWPDPYLGLARVYSYEQPNLPKLEEVLEQLSRRNYPWGRREKAMLADAHRFQGQQFQVQAVAAQGTEQERELLTNARDHYAQAVDLYREISPYAEAKANRAAVETQMELIDDRLSELGTP